MQKYTFLVMLLGAIFLNACKSDKHAFVDENPVILVSAIPAPPTNNEVNCEAIRKQFRIPQGVLFNCDSLNKIIQYNKKILGPGM